MTEEQRKISIQRAKILKGNPILSLVRPCKIGDGIVVLSEIEKSDFQHLFQSADKSCALFVPASGSGSRMFDFLHDYLHKPSEETRSQVEKFLANANRFAFFNQLPKDIQQKVLDLTIDISAFVSFLLEKNGMNFGALPKGLIPFHQMETFTLNPIQEQILQGKNIQEAMHFHFTIQSNFENQILESVKQLEAIDSKQVEITFSVQDESSDSYVFDEHKEVIMQNNGVYLRRPSGHGALLNNLQKLNADLVFVKNIDNIQTFQKSQKSVDTFKTLAGLLVFLKKELKEAVHREDISRIQSISDRYFLFSDEEIEAYGKDLQALTKRPMRICGMVKNEGQPGGGPYFVDADGIPKKQIVEKAQISLENHHQQLMLRSSHFNPVFMVLDFHDMEGNKFDLQQFRNDEQYFLVEKSQKGKSVKFIEQPGLWNGSMENWISVFVEIPEDTFSPVKTVLDLLDAAHR